MFITRRRGVSRQPQVAEDALDRRDLLLVRGIGGVDDVQQQVGLVQLLQRGAERARQVARQIADEPDGVGDDDLALAREAQPPRGRIQRREQPVLGQHVAAA